MRCERRLSRRALARAAGAVALRLGAPARGAVAQSAEPAFGYPIGLPGRALGDGFLIRHAYACENTWYNPGWWHTGEDWYRLDGDTAGTGVFAAAAGEVVFAGADYPGLVVIVRHAADLFSMYGHLDYAATVAAGQEVAHSQLLGRVLERSDGRAPSHLHFEMRTFLTTPEVNGDAPRYGFACGYDCPPGPGYWPIDAPEHPSAMGWRNPTHVVNRRVWPDGVPDDVTAIVAEGAPASLPLWSVPADVNDAARLGELALLPGDELRLLEMATGSEASTGTSAEGTRLWYRLAIPSDEPGWVQATVPSTTETGSDGRPSALRLVLLPVVTALAD